MSTTIAVSHRIEEIESCEGKHNNNENFATETDQFNYKNILTVVLVLLSCILFSAPIILIPQHDTILYPEYWYEGMINFNLTYPLHWICIIYMNNKLVLRLESLNTLKSFVLLYVLTVLSVDITYTTTYLVWTLALGLNWPMPFLGMVSYVGILVFLIALWFQFPQDMRLDKEGRKRIKAFLLLGFWTVIVSLQYQLYTKLFQISSQKIQWIYAFLLPLSLSYNKLVSNKIMKKCSTCDEHSTKMYNMIVVNGNHTLFIAIMVGSSATQMTTYCLFLVKFLVDLYHCYKIIKTDKKIAYEQLNVDTLIIEKENTFSLLALAEVMEVIIPLEFGITFLIAYNGPNFSILGNIGSSRWHFDSVKDIWSTIGSVSIMFWIDLCSGIIIGIILWKRLSVNLFKRCCLIMQVYWPWMAIRIVSLTTKVIFLITNNA